MSPVLLLSLLLVGLFALLPVWRLRVAGWPPRWLFAAWLVIAVTSLVLLRFPGPGRFLLPLLVLAYVAPFVAGPERLTRVLGGQRPDDGGVIIEVTPRLRLPAPDEETTDAEGREAADGDDRRGPSSSGER